MQDSHTMNWNRERHVPIVMLDSLRELNLRFLELVGADDVDWASSKWTGRPLNLAERIAPLTASQKLAVANCPYALFDLHFHNETYWHARLQNFDRWAVRDDAGRYDGTQEFVRLALFFSWHVASTGRLAAQFLLGMNEVTAAALRGITIDGLIALVTTEAANLTARWSHCSIYWDALTNAASRPNSAALRRIQLYGLQLAAAEQLT